MPFAPLFRPLESHIVIYRDHERIYPVRQLSQSVQLIYLVYMVDDQVLQQQQNDAADGFDNDFLVAVGINTHPDAFNHRDPTRKPNLLIVS